MAEALFFLTKYLVLHAVFIKAITSFILTLSGDFRGENQRQNVTNAATATA